MLSRNRTGCATEHLLSHPRVRIGAHYQEIAAAISGEGQKRVADLHPIHFDRLYLDIDLVAGEMHSDVGARHLPVTKRRALRVDAHHEDGIRLLEESALRRSRIEEAAEDQANQLGLAGLTTSLRSRMS